MNTTFLIIGLFVLVIVIFIIYRVLKVKAQNRKLNRKRFERIQPLFDKLQNSQPITAGDVLPYARNVLTREMTFRLLSEKGKEDMFPPEFHTLIKGAESSLASWLEFPTELDACPDEIEHVKRVTFDYDGENNFVHYEVFKYRISEPHWAAKNGWMLGVVGPYFDDSKPYDFAHFTFSRTSSTLDTISPEEEVKWVHEHLQKVR